jgi:hypothetical protein
MLNDKDPKPAPEGDKDYQNKTRGKQIRECTKKVEIWKKKK